jgi:hypothetical protein
MKAGDQASVTRAFAPEDVDAYSGLCGRLESQVVPEPLIGTLWSTLLGIHLPGTGTMYLKQDTRFHTPAAVGEPLIATVEITRIRPDKKLVDLKTTCHTATGTLVAEGRALVYIGFVEGALG